MSEQARVCLGATIGALAGAAAAYLFLTEGGRRVRDRIEPAVEDMRRELLRFQRTIEKVGDMAHEGRRVVSEFNAARAQSSYPPDGTSH